MEVSAASYYKWKAKYRGMSGTVAGAGNWNWKTRRLRKAVADLTLDIQVLKDVNSKTGKTQKQKGPLAYICKESFWVQHTKERKTDRDKPQRVLL